MLFRVFFQYGILHLVCPNLARQMLYIIPAARIAATGPAETGMEEDGKMKTTMHYTAKNADGTKNLVRRAAGKVSPAAQVSLCQRHAAVRGMEFVRLDHLFFGMSSTTKQK